MDRRFGPGPSRRSLLRGLGASCASLPFAHLLAPRHALGSDLGLAERLDLLYSNQFHFNDRGEPQITVGIMHGQSDIQLFARGKLRVLPSGEGGTAIDGGSTWRVTLQHAKPAKQRFSIVLESLPAGDGRLIERAVAKWRKLGFDPIDREVGALFGVHGRVLDTRKTLIAIGDFASETEAERKATALKQRHGALAVLHPVIEKRSSGHVVAFDVERGVTVRAQGVLWFASPHGEPITVTDVPHGTTRDKPARENRSYHGQIYVAVDRHGKLCVANRVSESDLLAGLVPAEIFATAPAAALEAQAVAARGQLIAKIGTRHLDDPYLLCSEQHCQVYAGIGREHPKTTAAVRRTAGGVLMRPNGSQLVDTVYSANCGGHTEDNDEVWPSPADPQLRGRPDPLLEERFASGIGADNIREWLTTLPASYSRPEDGHRAAYRWTEAVDPAAIAGRPGVPAELGTVQAIEVVERGRSGRATRVRIVGHHGAVDVQGELRIRRALGGLRSSMFVVLPDTDRYGRFQLMGGGHGHGVGLCQHGSMGMASAGKSHKQILAHYYPGSKIEKLW